MFVQIQIAWPVSATNSGALDFIPNRQSCHSHTIEPISMMSKEIGNNSFFYPLYKPVGTGTQPIRITCHIFKAFDPTEIGGSEVAHIWTHGSDVVFPTHVAQVFIIGALLIWNKYSFQLQHPCESLI